MTTNTKQPAAPIVPKPAPRAPWQYNAPFNAEFRGAKRARTGEDY